MEPNANANAHPIILAMWQQLFAWCERAELERPEGAR